MKHRRIASLGSVAGGLLGVAVLPVAVAFAAHGADGYTFTPDPADAGVGKILGFFGGNPTNLLEAPDSPAMAKSFQSYGHFDVSHGADSGDTDAYVSTTATNTMYLVADSPVAGVAPGSTFEFDDYNFLLFHIRATYSDVIDADGTHTFTDTWQTPLGSFPVPLKLDLSQPVFVPFHSLASGGGGGNLDDATFLTPDQLQGHLFDTANLPTGNTSYDPTLDWAPIDNIQVQAVSGVLPIDIAVQGYQNFDVTDPGDAAAGSVGTFTAAVTNTGDIVANSSQALLVTSSTGDAPPVGSVFMDFYLLGGNIVNHYSDIVGGNPDGTNKITDVLENVKTGKLTPMPSFENFDAAAHLNDQGYTIDAHGFSISPDGNQLIVAQNGLPPISMAVQGYQNFDFDTAGDDSGSFTGDMTTSMNIFGDGAFIRSLLVTDSDSDLLGNGSVFINYVDGDWGNVYSDVVTGTAAAGDIHHTIFDVIQTPWFDIPIHVPALFGLPELFAGFFVPDFP